MWGRWIGTDPGILTFPDASRSCRIHLEDFWGFLLQILQMTCFSFPSFVFLDFLLRFDSMLVDRACNHG